MKKSVKRLIEFAVIAIVLCASPFVAPARPEEPPKDRFLRIEAGMHIAPIKQIATDRENRYLATASNDKTVKIWDLGTGRLSRTLRPPIGEGFEGMMYAVALSPDGATVACGGFTGPDGGADYPIYLFSLETGRLIKRLPGLPDATNHLVYSPDGGYLAATLGGKNGIRIYDTKTYDLIFADTGYGDSSYGADFTGRTGL